MNKTDRECISALRKPINFRKILMASGTQTGHFKFFQFFRNENFFESFILIFDSSLPKGFSWQNMKDFEIWVLSPNSRFLRKGAIKLLVYNCFYNPRQKCWDTSPFLTCKYKGNGPSPSNVENSENFSKSYCQLQHWMGGGGAFMNNYWVQMSFFFFENKLNQTKIVWCPKDFWRGL
mgnify:CR=1 FL=1